MFETSLAISACNILTIKTLNMHKTFLIFLICSIACSCSQKDNEENAEETGTPFPKKYLNFYAGMTVDELTKNLESQHFKINYRVYKFEENNGDPRIEASREKLQLTAWIYHSKVSGINITGKKDTTFFNDLMEISRSFDAIEYSMGYGEAYHLDNLKTSVHPYDHYLSLFDIILTDSLSIEATSYKEKELKKVRKKYE